LSVINFFSSYLNHPSPAEENQQFLFDRIPHQSA
jgi:hypothetical protein